MIRIPPELSEGECWFKGMPVENLDALANLSKGLAHPTRVRIVSMLARMHPRERIVCAEIVAAFPHAQSTISQHLKVLKDTGWIRATVEYPRIFYSLTGGILEKYRWLLHSCTEHSFGQTE